MPDIADIAQIEIERSLERTLSQRKTVSGIGPLVCLCGVKMPQKRREAGYSICIECAEKQETRQC